MKLARPPPGEMAWGVASRRSWDRPTREVIAGRVVVGGVGPGCLSINPYAHSPFRKTPPLPSRSSGLKKLQTQVAAVAAGHPDRPLRLMFEDEARFGRMSNPIRCWAPAGCRPEVATHRVREYTHVFGSGRPLHVTFEDRLNRLAQARQPRHRAGAVVPTTPAVRAGRSPNQPARLLSRRWRGRLSHRSRKNALTLLPQAVWPGRNHSCATRRTSASTARSGCRQGLMPCLV